MKGLLLIILLVATITYCVLLSFPQGEEGNKKNAREFPTTLSPTYTVMHIDNKLARNIE